jgi:hypothetical protein
MTRAPLRRTLVLALLGLALVALPAAAEVYHVNLKSGSQFDSRYPPEEASWDANTLLFITETGNWIGISRDQIESVKAETETRGHGTRINATTLYMGKAPNANQTPDQQAAGQNPQLQLLQKLIDRQSQQQDYSVQQFVDPGQAGKGGLPVGYATGTQGVGAGIGIGIPTQAPAPTSPPQ